MWGCIEKSDCGDLGPVLVEWTLEDFNAYLAKGKSWDDDIVKTVAAAVAASCTRSWTLVETNVGSRPEFSGKSNVGPLTVICSRLTLSFLGNSSTPYDTIYVFVQVVEPTQQRHWVLINFTKKTRKIVVHDSRSLDVKHYLATCKAYLSAAGWGEDKIEVIGKSRTDRP
jgi:hypothetical protein